VLCIFVLPSIYSMAVMDGARLHLCGVLTDGRIRRAVK
jgi:hypothetical protein